MPKSQNWLQLQTRRENFM